MKFIWSDKKQEVIKLHFERFSKLKDATNTKDKKMNSWKINEVNRNQWGQKSLSKKETVRKELKLRNLNATGCRKCDMQ